MKTGRDQMPRKWGEKEARKAENVVGGRRNRDLERVGGEWRITATDRSGRLLIENGVREKMR